MQRFLSAAGRPRRRAAVLGSPIAHSLSPVLHRAAYDAIGMDWSYEAIECDQAALPATLDRLAGTHVGLSLTMPLKQAVLGLLDDLDPLARQLGAVNTVVYEAGGARRGYNTDVGGALAALAEADVTATGGGSARPSTVLLGGGGAARAALAALAQLGRYHVVVAIRDPGRADALEAMGGGLGVEVQAAPFSSAATLIRHADLVVSAVPARAADPVAAELAGDWPRAATLFDLVYAPWPTAIAAAAGAAGAKVVGGLPMLVAQAGAQVRLMTGRVPPMAPMRAAGESALAGS